MSEVHDDSSLTIETQGLALLRWGSWPVRDNWLRSALIGIGLLGVGVMVYLMTEGVLLAALAVGAMAGAMWRFFLPIEYELNDQGVDQKVLRWHRRIPWESIQRYEICDAGVLLLPQANSELSAMRGLYMPWTIHRDEVVLRVRYYLDPSNDDTPPDQTEKIEIPETP